MVYSARIVKGATVGTARKLLKRAGTLYSASAALALAFYSLNIFTSLRLWVERSDAGVLDPVGEVLEILTLRRAFHGSDVLITYTLMLAVAPAIVYLLHKGRTPVVLAASIALWGLQQSSLLGFSHIWSVADSSFPLFAWQLLMVLGLITGFHYRAISTWLVDRRRADLCAIGAIGLYLGLMWLYRYQGSHLLPAGPGDMAIDGGLFDKTNLAIGRVLAFLCLDTPLQAARLVPHPSRPELPLRLHHPPLRPGASVQRCPIPALHGAGVVGPPGHLQSRLAGDEPGFGVADGEDEIPLLADPSLIRRLQATATLGRASLEGAWEAPGRDDAASPPPASVAGVWDIV